MKKSIVSLGLLMLAGSSVGAQAADYIKGEIVVKFRDGVHRSNSKMNAFYDSVGVERVQRLLGLGRGVERLKISSNVKIQDAIQMAMQDPDVEYAQPNYLLKVQPVQEMGMYKKGTPVDQILSGWPGDNGPGKPPTPVQDPALEPAPADVNPPVADPQMAELYGMEKIGAMEAWKTFRGDRKMVVGVIDTGVDYNHEDLANNINRNDVGYDFVHNDDLPFDDHSHGTHVSGTIGAVGGNGKGVVGVNQLVSIMGLKFLSAEGSGTTVDAIRAIDFAAEHGAKVLNASWGGPSEGEEANKALFDAIDRAGKKDVLFIVAAGNESANNDGSNGSYPAKFNNENLIAVAATDRNDNMASFSNYGATTVHLAAPGVKILSTIPGNRYRAYDGTSMATPHVVGAAALIWAKHPAWDFRQVKEALLKSVDEISSLKGKTITGGRLNVLKAMNM